MKVIVWNVRVSAIKIESNSMGCWNSVIKNEVSSMECWG
jgi:hypothetical protein